ncbi:DUF1648 domain-containing protein [Leucobacter chromiireducens]|uniref:DUF1648 domain-containing protein n=1 Tax=Leucobacter chromiireducens TaxID=283877 RepID=UPI000F6351A9|nr:DUF1648 domain-containing protein [Leucobacter chromiireducens]
MNAELRRARSAARWVALIVPLGITALAAALLLVWLPRLPDPAATHWSGMHGPDGFGPPWTFAALSAGIGVPLVLLLWFASVGSASGRKRRLPRWSGFNRLLAALSAGTTVMLQFFLVAGAVIQLDVADARLAPPLGWAGLLGIALLPLGGALAWAVQPAVTVDERDTQPARAMELGISERAVWYRTARSSAAFVGVLLGATACLWGGGIWLLSDGRPEAWILLGVGALIAVLIPATTVFRVRVDAAGLTARSALGWPVLRVPLAEVGHASAESIQPLADFGGWGIRWAPGRTGVVLRAGSGIVVTRHDGRIFAVTVDDADTAAALLTGLAARVDGADSTHGGTA